MKGNGKEAAIILRVLFEHLLDFKYIGESKKRLNDFLYFDSKKKLDIGKKIPVQFINNKDAFEMRNKELLLKNEKIKDRYHAHKRKNDWREKSLELIAKELGLLDAYNLLYTYTSMYVHLSPTTFDDYILGLDNDKEVVVLVGASEDLLDEVLVTTARIVNDMFIKVVNQRYDMGFDSEIIEIEKRSSALSLSKN